MLLRGFLSPFLGFPFVLLRKPALFKQLLSVVFCDFGLDADGASVARHVSRCDPRVLIAEAGEYYELRGGGS